MVLWLVKRRRNWPLDSISTPSFHLALSKREINETIPRFYLGRGRGPCRSFLGAFYEDLRFSFGKATQDNDSASNLPMQEYNKVGPRLREISTWPCLAVAVYVLFMKYCKICIFRDTKVGSGSFLDRRMLCHATNYSSSTGQSISPDPYFPHFAPLFAHPETPIDSRTRTREGRTFLWSFSPLMMFSHDRTDIVDRF